MTELSVIAAAIAVATYVINDAINRLINTINNKRFAVTINLILPDEE